MAGFQATWLNDFRRFATVRLLETIKEATTIYIICVIKRDDPAQY